MTIEQDPISDASEPSNDSHATQSHRGPFAISALLALVSGLICTAFALRSHVLQSWLIWYEMGFALLAGYTCVVATCICMIRSRFSLNRWLVTSLAGLLSASYGLYFFHIAYSPDLFFRFSESDIQSHEMIILCDIERKSRPPQYRVAEVLRNETQLEYQIGTVLPNLDTGMDAFLSRPGTGDQILFFAEDDGETNVSITWHQQVYSGKIAGFKDTRLKHLSDLSKFRRFVASGTKNSPSNTTNRDAESKPTDNEFADMIPENPERPFYFAFSMLHQPDPVLQQRVPSTKKFAQYGKKIDAACMTFFKSLPESEGRTCSIVFAVKPKRQSRIWIEYHPKPLSEEDHDALLGTLHAIEAPEVREGPVSMAMFCLLWGGVGRDNQQNFSSIPKEWKKVGGLIPDEPLSEIWPDSEQ